MLQTGPREDGLARSPAVARSSRPAEGRKASRGCKLLPAFRLPPAVLRGACGPSWAEPEATHVWPEDSRAVLTAASATFTGTSGADATGNGHPGRGAGHPHTCRCRNLRTGWRRARNWSSRGKGPVAGLEGRSEGPSGQEPLRHLRKEACPRHGLPCGHEARGRAGHTRFLFPWLPGPRWGAGATCPVPEPHVQALGALRQGQSAEEAGRQRQAGPTERLVTVRAMAQLDPGPWATHPALWAPASPGHSSEPRLGAAGDITVRERWRLGWSPRSLLAPGHSLRFFSAGGQSPRGCEGKAARGQRVTPPPAQLQAAKPWAGLTPLGRAGAAPAASFARTSRQWAPQPPPSGDAALPHATPSPGRPGTNSAPAEPEDTSVWPGWGPRPVPLSDPWCLFRFPPACGVY